MIVYMQTPAYVMKMFVNANQTYERHSRWLAPVRTLIGSLQINICCQSYIYRYKRVALGMS